MDNKPTFDRSLYIPLFIGILSVVGICSVLIALRLGSARGSIQNEATNTPVKYSYLGTEPVVVQSTKTQTATPEEAPTAIIATRKILSPTFTATLAFTPVNSPTNSPTPTPTGPTSEPTGTTYDDFDPQLAYTGNWVPQSGLSSAYKNSLHISSTIGDAVHITFYGEKFRLMYQAGPSLGTVAIKVDSSDYVLDQSATETGNSVWESPVLPATTYTVTITHISGGSINIDALVLFALATPTPTSTPTATPTQ